MPAALPRRILTLTALLLFGAATSILIAWSIELGAAYAGTRYRQSGTFRLTDPATPGEFVRGEIGKHFGATVCSATRMSAGGADPVTHLPTWFTLPRSGIGETTGAMAVGIPFRCLCCDYDYQSAAGKSFRPIQYQHGFSVVVPGRIATLIFATRPIIPGLLANTAIYATLLATTFWLHRLTRRHLRLRRGHCPACDYDLRSDYNQPCPECGRLTSPPPTSPSTPQP